MDRQADRVSRVGNTKLKTEGSSRVANMESRVIENLANTESRVMENSANTKSRVTQNSANTESRVTENSVDTENRVMHDSGGRKLEEGKGANPSKRPAPRWCLRGITKTQKTQNAKDVSKRVGREKKKRKSRTIGLTVYSP
jgi:hypothetical protein